MNGEYGGNWEEEDGNADYGGMVQPSQQHVAPCVKVVESGFGRKGRRKQRLHRCANSKKNLRRPIAKTNFRERFL